MLSSSRHSSQSPINTNDLSSNQNHLPSASSVPHQLYTNKSLQQHPPPSQKPVQPYTQKTQDTMNQISKSSSQNLMHTQQEPSQPHHNGSKSHPSSSTESPSTASTSTGPKLLSRNFFEASTGDIILLVSSMLQELVNLNDALPLDTSKLTRFHSRSPPGISIKDYLVRITKFCSLEKSILLAIIYYIDLLCTTYKIFNINSLTVHRFLITAAMVASKGLCDTFCTNTHYAKVGGLSKIELNSLEVEFLIRVDYRIVPEVERLNQYFDRMVTRMSGKYAFEPAVKKSLPVPVPKSNQYPQQQSNGLLMPMEIAQREGRTNATSPLKRHSAFEDSKDRTSSTKQRPPSFAPREHASANSSVTSHVSTPGSRPIAPSISAPALAVTAAEVAAAHGAEDSDDYISSEDESL